MGGGGLLEEGAYLRGGCLIEDLRHNSTGKACFEGYALLAAILVSYVPGSRRRGF